MSKPLHVLFSEILRLVEIKADKTTIWKELTPSWPELSRPDLNDKFLPELQKLVDSGKKLVINQFHLAAEEYHFLTKLIDELEELDVTEPDELREILGWITRIKGENEQLRLQPLEDVLEKLDNERLKLEAELLWPSRFEGKTDE